MEPGDLQKYHGVFVECTNATQDIAIVVSSIIGNPLFFIDIIRHEGFFHDTFTIDRFFTLNDWPRIIIMVGPAKLDASQVTKLTDHVKAGNGLLVVGMIEALEGMLGVMYRVPVFPFPVGGIRDNSIGEGYLQVTDETLRHGLPETWFPLHAFACAPVLEDGATVLATYDAIHGSTEHWVAITRNEISMGIAVQVGIDIAKTIRFIQEGRYVDQDGIPPADGMAPVDDGILKCEDGLVLDWTRDRRPVSNSHRVPAFMLPVADAWRKLLSTCVEIVVDHCEVPAKRFWYWPDDAEFIGLISHDSDGNDEALADHLLGEIEKTAIHTTWHLQPPGYSKKTCNAILLSGHELGLHFDTISYPDGKQKDDAGMNALFTSDMLEQQLTSVKQHAGIETIYSNKNHYTRWAGRVQFFNWCESLGIHVDQSKGPSKCGTIGFPFGTCHPWQPMDDDGNLIGCMEIGFQSQDFGLQGPADIVDDLITAVKQVHGVVHVIFHPAHSNLPAVNNAMHEFIEKVQSSGGIFARSIDIAEWTFDRKVMVANGIATSRSATIQVREAGRWVLLDAGV